jgi:rRNA-processing protein CGR1
MLDVCGTQIDILRSRTFLPEGVKTKSWDDRMEKTQRAMAVKKLESELKEEKVAEMKR